MAETLGEAVLYLRTDDSGLDRGITRAKTGAQGVSMSFDQASASSGRLSRSFAEAGKSSDRLGESMVRQRARGREMVISAGAQRAGMQQLSMQLGDVATMYSMGMRPMQIYTSQIGQVTQAIALMRGGAGGLVGFLAGPWGMALTTASIVLVPFISRLFEADQAMEAVEEGADAMARAQSALAPVFDLVSGKLKTQNELLIINARLLAINLRAEAQAKRAGARDTLIDAQRVAAPGFFEAQTIGISGLGPRTGEANADAVRELLQDIGAGRISRADAIARAETMDFSGTKVTRNKFMEALRDATVANLNERAAALIDQSLDSGELAAGLREPGKASKAKKDIGRTAAEIERRFHDQLDGYRAQIASANARIATSAEEEAELALRGVEWARRQTLRSIEADKELSDTQKARLAEAAENLAEAERQAVAFRKTQRLEREAEALADEAHRAAVDGLQVQLQIADTEAARKDIALQIFDAEQAYLKAKLEAVIASETATAAERERAELLLDQLAATAGARREGVARANETEVERYLRHLNKTPEQINEAIDGIKIDGLEALNDGLVDAIMGFESLGDTAEEVSKQIVADLLRIAVQRMVTAPLARMLFGAPTGGGPENLLAGTPYGGGGVFAAIGDFFSGFFADGGLIPAGSFGIVGERGPEPVIGTNRGAMVLPNSAIRDGAFGPAPVNVTFHDPFKNAAGVRRSAAQAGAAIARIVGEGQRGL